MSFSVPAVSPPKDALLLSPPRNDHPSLDLDRPLLGDENILQSLDEQESSLELGDTSSSDQSSSSGGNPSAIRIVARLNLAMRSSSLSLGSSSLAGGDACCSGRMLESVSSFSLFK